MPASVQRISQVVESNQAWRQCPKFPKSPVLVLPNNNILGQNQRDYDIQEMDDILELKCYLCSIAHKSDLII